MAAKLKKGDKVVVLAGKDKGKEGEIVKVDAQGRQGRGRRREHRHPPHPPDPDQPGRPHAQGDADRPVEPRAVDPNGKPTRVGFRMEDGKKVRFAKTTGDVIDA
jgi:large subunit ribosomal protein L24